MSGAYNGSYHGGNDFTGESVQQVHENLKAAAMLNGSSLGFVNAGWSDAGFQLSVSGTNGGAGVPSGGPGSPSVGAAPTGGPGNGAVSGKGFVGTGAGNAAIGGTWFQRAISLNWGSTVLPLSDPKKNVVTEMTYFGIKTIPHQGFSDAQTNENRAGDSEVWSTIDGTLIRGADAWNTWSQAGVPFVKQTLRSGWGVDFWGDGSLYVGDPKLDPKKNVDRGVSIDWMGDGKNVTRLW